MVGFEGLLGVLKRWESMRIVIRNKNKNVECFVLFRIIGRRLKKDLANHICWKQVAMIQWKQSVNEYRSGMLLCHPIVMLLRSDGGRWTNQAEKCRKYYANLFTSASQIHVWIIQYLKLMPTSSKSYLLIYNAAFRMKMEKSCRYWRR